MPARLEGKVALITGTGGRQGRTAAMAFAGEGATVVVERFNDSLLIKRLGSRSDIAPAAVYLASGEASWVTGANIVVDGGFTAW